MPTISGPGETRLSASSLVRDYIDSLPSRLSNRDELKSFQFWKSLRTELLSSILFTVFCNGPLPSGSTTPLEKSISFGLTVSTLIQCTGHVSGCHLTISITLALLVSGRVSLLRLFSYLLMHFIGSLIGTTLLWSLSGSVPILGPSSVLQNDLQRGPSRVFGTEFLFVFIVSLTYLANVDQRRSDLGFKSLSIGLSALAGHLFAFPNTGAVLSPCRAFASNLFEQKWCLHWIYWIATLFGGLAAGIVYEYIGSVKPVNPRQRCNQKLSSSSSASSSSGCDYAAHHSQICDISSQPLNDSNSSSLKHDFTTNIRSPSCCASSNSIPLTNSSQSISTIANFQPQNNSTHIPTLPSSVSASFQRVVTEM